MKASYLLKTNIDALLKARHQSRHDLAIWCRRSDAWLSKILGKDNRNIPLEYLDRIADFFGLATYQLFQPGISPLHERRKGSDRRSGRDRRLSAVNHSVRESVSATVANLTAADVADLIRWKTLSADSRAAVRETMQAVERSERQTARRGRARPAAGMAGGAATPPEGLASRRQKNSGTGG